MVIRLLVGRIVFRHEEQEVGSHMHSEADEAEGQGIDLAAVPGDVDLVQWWAGAANGSPSKIPLVTI